MTESIQILEKQLDTATDARTVLLAKMEGDYDSTHLETFSNLQVQIKNYKEQLETARTTEASADVGTCQVYIFRGGKDDQTYEIRADSTLQDLMTHIGWDTSALTFKSRLGVGSYEEISDPGSHVFGPGEHEISATHRVAAG